MNCARCFTPTPAACLISFTYEDVIYEMDLCERHTEMFDRDLTAWTRMARESELTLPQSEPLPDHTLRFPVADGGVVVKDSTVPGRVRGEITAEAMEYTFTEHALERMRLRHLDRQDVFRALSAPDRTTREGLGSKWPGSEVWVQGEVKLVVNPKQRRVISVMWRTEEMTEERKKQNGG